MLRREAPKHLYVMRQRFFAALRAAQNDIAQLPQITETRPPCLPRCGIQAMW